MKTKLIIIGLAALLAAGCQNPGVVQVSPDTYMLCRSSAAGAFANIPKLKAGVIRDANAFAAAKGKIAVPVSSSDTFPTHGFPSYEFQFRLADKESVEAEASAVSNFSIGQQLIDLQKAKDAGAITEAEFQAQKTKLLGKN